MDDRVTFLISANWRHSSSRSSWHLTFNAPIRYLELWSNAKPSVSEIGLVGVAVEVDDVFDFGLLVDISRGFLLV